MAVPSQSVQLGSPPGQRLLPETKKQRPSRAPRQQLILAEQMSGRPLVIWPEKLRLAIEAAQPLLATERLELPQLMALLGSHLAKDFPVRLGRARRC